MIDVSEILRGLEIERQCVSRDCDRNCFTCNLAQDQQWILSVYDGAIEEIQAHLPSVIDADALNGLDEGDAVFLEMRTSAYPGTEAFTGWALFRETLRVRYRVEDIGSDWDWMYYFAYPDNASGIIRNTLPLRLSDYGNEWRLWTAKPDGQQREAVKWE